MNPAIAKIHEALHDPKKPGGIRIEGQVLPIITLEKNNCRFCVWRGVTIMQQNPKTGTPYALRAQAGETLSWVMWKDKPWELIETPIPQ